VEASTTPPWAATHGEKTDELAAVSDAATDPWRDEPDSVGGVGG